METLIVAGAVAGALVAIGIALRKAFISARNFFALQTAAARLVNAEMTVNDGGSLLDKVNRIATNHATAQKHWEALDVAITETRKIATDTAVELRQITESTATELKATLERTAEELAATHRQEQEKLSERITGLEDAVANHGWEPCDALATLQKRLTADQTARDAVGNPAFEKRLAEGGMA